MQPNMPFWHVRLQLQIKNVVFHLHAEFLVCLSAATVVRCCAGPRLVILRGASIRDNYTIAASSTSTATPASTHASTPGASTSCRLRLRGRCWKRRAANVRLRSNCQGRLNANMIHMASDNKQVIVPQCISSSQRRATTGTYSPWRNHVGAHEAEF